MFFILTQLALAGPDTNWTETPSTQEDSSLEKSVEYNTQYFRKNTKISLHGTYSLIDMILPGKWGTSIAWHKSEETTFELDFAKGSVSAPFFKDLGELTDTRISLMVRSYFGNNSFNIHYGVSYFDFKIQLGSALLSRLSNQNIPSIDLLRQHSIGSHAGIGNRWILNNGITFTLDWISLYQPLIVLNEKNVFLDYVTNEDDKSDVDLAFKLLHYLPRFTFLKFQMGFSF